MKIGLVNGCDCARRRSRRVLCLVSCIVELDNGLSRVEGEVYRLPACSVCYTVLCRSMEAQEQDRECGEKASEGNSAEKALRLLVDKLTGKCDEGAADADGKVGSVSQG